jgi:hypothetical protein
MSTPHTPGPWRVGDIVGDELDERLIEGPHGEGVGTTWMMGADFDGENEYAEREANARLIAAAPELFDLVQGWLVEDDLTTLPRARAIARATIARIAGEQ